MTTTDRELFGTALREALGVRGLTQVELARRLGTSQPAVSDWILGKSSPPADTVFEIERTLEVEPGHFSRFLGYLPTEAVSVNATFETVVMSDSLLDEPAKRGLLAMYRELTSRRPKSGRRSSN